MAGRFAGKTFAGAHWFNSRMMEQPFRQGAVIGATLDDARDICVLDPESGLLAHNRRIRYLQPHTLVWPNGSRARLFGAYKPEDVERMRGRNLDYAWLDEPASWRMLEQLWPIFEMALRHGERPQAILTTTPRPRAKMFEIYNHPLTVVTHATSWDNPAISDEIKQELKREYGDSALGQQELEGKLLEEVEDAVIPLSWLYEALARRREGVPARVGVIAAGLDVARFGQDKTAIVVTQDTDILALAETEHQSVMETVGWTLDIIERWGVQTLAVDDTGVGGGVTDRLTELLEEGSGPSYYLVPVIFGARAFDHQRFHNKSSEMWWRVREACHPEAPLPLSIPGDHPLAHKLIIQLSSARRAFDSTGLRRIWVDKTGAGHFSQRLDARGRSPDLADALCLALEAWACYHAQPETERLGLFERPTFLGMDVQRALPPFSSHPLNHTNELYFAHG